MTNKTNYEEIKKICLRNKEISKSLVDDFLMYYTASQYNLEKNMNKQFDKFYHITREFPPGTIGMLKAQYIVHKLFKKDGLIKKVKNHSALKNLTTEEKKYIAHQEKYPWRFSFSVITDNPAEDFFEMEDVFTGESYLLYSPGVSDTLSEHNPAVWFNLISYNGTCYETYGVIAFYNGFQPGDIIFFGQETDPYNKWIDSGEELTEDVENDPVPYMMLLTGAFYPFIFHKEYQMVNCFTDYDIDDFEPPDYKKDFKIEYNDGVYKLSPDKWSEYPHFAEAYYEENEYVLFLCSMTDLGFEKLIQLLNKYGNDFDEIPDFRVNSAMIVVAGNILQKEIKVNIYESMFEIKPTEKEQEETDKINEAIQMMLPDINSGKQPDIEQVAKKTGVDAKTLNDLIQDVLNKYK